MKTRPWRFVDLAGNAPVTCTFRARELKTKKPSSVAQGNRVSLKIVNYDKIRFTFLDIVKNQPFDLM